MAESTIEKSDYQGPAFFSYGFRPFFLGAALFAGVAIPAWILTLAGVGDADFLYPARDWHVHEMVFGFLPAVITGFLLTAIPNWTDRPPIRGVPLMLLLALWLAGRVVMTIPWLPPFVSVMVDGAFLLVVAGILWREIIAGAAWDRLPMGVLISLYACANVFFHVLVLRGDAPDLPERVAFALIIMLLTLIGGRITPSFTEDFLAQEGITERPFSFSAIDGLSIALSAVASVTWIIHPQGLITGWSLVVAGFMNVIRLVRWKGWMTWREPLVLVLHVGYGWLMMSLLLLGGSLLGLSLPTADAVHALTTGAVGVMTLAVMTRASLGHTGRPKQAGPMTVIMYISVNLGAILRVFGPATGIPDTVMFGMATVCWSGAYLLFTLCYGPMLFRQSLDN